MKKKEIEEVKKESKGKESFNYINMFQMLRNLLIRDNPGEELLISSIMDQLKKISHKNDAGSYPLEKFYPFFWIAIYAQIHSLPNKVSKTSLKIIFSADNKEIDPNDCGHYIHRDNLIRVRKDLPIEEIVSTFVHEITHSVTNFIYDDACMPPLKLWSPFLSIRAAISNELSPADAKERNFFSGLDSYERKILPAELIARTVQFAVLNGDIPFQYTDSKLEEALKKFLTDCEDYLKKSVESFSLAKIFPWLPKTFDFQKDSLQCPEEEYKLFISISSGRNYWDTALKSKNMAIFNRIMIWDPGFLIFPLQNFYQLESSQFKLEVASLFHKSKAFPIKSYLAVVFRELSNQIIYASFLNQASAALGNLLMWMIMQAGSNREFKSEFKSSPSRQAENLRFNFNLAQNLLKEDTDSPRLQ